METTPQSSRRRRISSLPCAELSSPPLELPGSDAPHCAGSSFTSRSPTTSSTALRPRTRNSRSVVPFDSGVLVGPLINEAAFETMQKSLSAARADGGTVVCGGDRVGDSGFYVTPALVRMPAQTEVVRAETFAPILYVLTLHRFRRRHCAAQRRTSRTFVLDLYTRPARSRALPRRRRLRLRHREREHRNVRCGDRRRIRRGEGDWRRTRVGFGFVEGIHAPSHQYRQLLGPASAGSRGRVRLNTCRAKSVIASINSGSADNCGAWSVPRLTTWAPGTSLCMAR